jgi:hypothetical protein
MSGRLQAAIRRAQRLTRLGDYTAAAVAGAMLRVIEAQRVDPIAVRAGARAAAEREAVQAAARSRQAEADRREQARRSEDLLAALGAAAATLAAGHAPAYEEVADTLTDGALAIARAAVGRELLSVGDDLERRVRAAVRTLAGDGHLVVHLHPDDAAILAGAALPPGAELVPDASVPRGTVSVRGEVQRLHHDVAAAVAAAQEVLRS